MSLLKYNVQIATISFVKNTMPQMILKIYTSNPINELPLHMQVKIRISQLKKQTEINLMITKTQESLVKIKDLSKFLLKIKKDPKMNKTMNRTKGN